MTNVTELGFQKYLYAKTSTVTDTTYYALETSVIS